MTLPQTMNAVEIVKPGGPEVLQPTTIAVPEPGEGEVLIKVAAAGINRPDVLQRKGGYNPPPGASPIPGLELAGEVVALGHGVHRWRIGDKVMALVAGGGYAQFASAPEGQCLAIPAGLSMIEAGAIPETYFTVWHNVFERGQLKPVETLLVHGGSSGIGTTAIQLAAAFGARVLATAGNKEKCEACVKLGAERAFDYGQDDWVKGAREATDGKGVDVILDMVGGDYVAKDIEALAPDGRLVFIAFQKGSKAELDLLPMMMKRLTVTGSTLRPRTVAFKSALARHLEEKVSPLLAAGRCKPLIFKTFPLAQAADAHRLMESSTHIGKIVLTI